MQAKRPTPVMSMLAFAVSLFLSASVGMSEVQIEAKRFQTTNSEAKEGCYFLKDSAGRWSVCWLGRASKGIAGRIRSRGSLTIDSTCGSVFAARKQQPNVIYFGGETLDSSICFCFVSSESQFDIDVLFDGGRIPEKVFLGEDSVSPGTLPIRVEDKVEPIEMGWFDTAKLESTALSRRVAGSRGIKDNGRVGVRNSELSHSAPETPPGTTSHSVDKRSGNPALQLPNDRRGWPAVPRPDPSHRMDGFAPDDSTSTITEVYDVATGKIRRLDEGRGE